MCMERSSTAGSPATYHEHVSLVVGRQINSLCNRAITLQQRCQLDHGLIPFIGTKADGTICACTKIRMVLVDQLVTIRRREFGKGLFAPRIPGLVHDLLKGVNIHDWTFSYQYSASASVKGWELTADCSSRYFTVAQ